VAARYSEFHWVKASDLKTARDVDSPQSGSFIVLDPDGDRVGCWSVLRGGEQAFLDAMDKAKQKYVSKDISWMDGEPDLAAEENKTKLVLYAFVDDKDASAKVLKNLSHPWISKDHDRMLFVKTTGRDNELAKRLQVSTIPTLVFVAPILKESERIVERKGGDIQVRSIRAIQKRAFALIKKANEK
jgi:hypothetical protein